MTALEYIDKFSSLYSRLIVECDEGWVCAGQFQFPACAHNFRNWDEKTAERKRRGLGVNIFGGSCDLGHKKPRTLGKWVEVTSS